MNASECDTKHDFEHMLKTAGLRVTLGRLAALTVLHTKGAQSADQLVSASKGAFDRVTAYRTLKQFLAAGIIVPIAHAEGAMRYELADHHSERLVCTRCGASEALAGCDFAGLEQQVMRKSSAFSRVEAHLVVLLGICKRCAPAA